MKKETQEKLMQAIYSHNQTQENEQDKVNINEVLTEIGSLDNEELEKATKEMQSNLEKRNEQ